MDVTKELLLLIYKRYFGFPVLTVPLSGLPFFYSLFS